MGSFWQDVKFGLRMLTRNRGVTAVAIIALALGIGANTAIFSVVNGVLLRPLEYRDPDRLVWFWEMQPALPHAPFSAADFLDYRAQNQTFESMAGYRPFACTLTGLGDPERVRVGVVTPDFFPMLGIPPELGRDFTAADGESKAPRVALLTHGFWQSHFGGSREVPGKTIVLNGETVTIIGVLPATFRFSQRNEIWMNPHDVVPEVFPNYTGEIRTERGMHYLAILGRMKPRITLAQAQADMSRIATGLQQKYSSNVGHGVELLLLREYIVGNVRAMLLVLLGVVGVVLLIACANVANLLLVRAAARQQEIAIRTALGAGRVRIVRQLLTESVLLALAGGALGLAGAYGGVRLLVAIHPASLPRVATLGVDLRVLTFTLGVALLTGILFGLAPAVQAGKLGLAETLKEGGRGGSVGQGQTRLRGLLVTAEVAMSLVLLIAAGLLGRSFYRLLQVQPGFNPDHLVTMAMNFSSQAYARRGSVALFVDRLLPRVKSLPGVEDATISNDLPIEGDDTTTGVSTIEGREKLQPGHEMLVGVHVVTPGFFHALGIPLLQGRDFTAADVFSSTPVIVVNQKLAEAFWPGQSAIGKHVNVMGPKEEEVVGIVGNVHHNGLGQGFDLETYSPLEQVSWSFLSLSIRTKRDAGSLVSAVRSVAAGIDPELPIHDVATMDQIEAETLTTQRQTLALVGIFAALALALAAVGIYGVMSYAVMQRTHEIGVRMALGAQPGDVVRLLVAQGMKLTIAGLLLGLGGALALTRYLASLLFEVRATDPLTFASVAALLAGVALLATYVPSRRATRVDPLVSLRYE